MCVCALKYSSQTVRIGTGIVSRIRFQTSNRRGIGSKQSTRSGRNGGKNLFGKRTADGGFKQIERFAYNFSLVFYCGKRDNCSKKK